MDILSFVVDKEGRIDVFLTENSELSRSYVKRLCEEDLVFVDGKPVKKSGEKVSVGQTVEVELPPLKEISAKPEDIPLNIVYEDEDIIVVNKPQGMVTHPSVGSPDGTLVNALMFHAEKLSSINGEIRPGIVHRLDKNTSGLLVVAKTDAAHLSLSKQIESKSASRQYIALVDGNIKEDEGKIEQPIGRNPKDRKTMAVVKDGRYALTYFKVLERFGPYTLVEFTLKTGRTHQIRVHSKFIRHTVVGDPEYGGSTAFKTNGQLLHAYKLSFVHPRTGEEMCFEAPLPEYFQVILDKLRKK